MRLCLLATFFFAPDSPEMIRINKILSSNSAVVEKLLTDAQRAKELPGELDTRVLALLFPSASIGANLVGFLMSEKRLTAQSLTELRKIIELLHASSRMQQGEKR